MLRVDVDVIRLEKWSPALQIRTVLLSIQALLSAPNPDDFLDADVAEKWKADERGAKAIGSSPHPHAHRPALLFVF